MQETHLNQLFAQEGRERRHDQRETRHRKSRLRAQADRQGGGRGERRHAADGLPLRKGIHEINRGESASQRDQKARAERRLQVDDEERADKRADAEGPRGRAQ